MPNASVSGLTYPMRDGKASELLANGRSTSNERRPVRLPRTFHTLALIYDVRYYLTVPYTPDHRRRTRSRILEGAGRIVRRRGATGAGVDAIMADAGLTAGGFYAHFRKKDALLAEIVGGGFGDLRKMLFAGLEHVRGVPFLTAIARRYLSRSHRDDVENGCIVPAVLGDVPRLGSEVGTAFEDAFRDLLDRLAPHVPATAVQTSRERAMATMALFAGGLMLARAVDDRELSNQILAACRHLAVPEAYAVDGPVKGERS